MIRRNAFITATAFLALLTVSAVPAQETVKQIPDQEVADAVEDEIILDPAVNANRVDVNVETGVVILSGTASNIMAKERAANLAETVRGVRSVVNEIAVRPREEYRDAEIEDAAEAALLANPATELYDVDVEVNEGVVNLTGAVDSWQEQQLSVKTVKQVNGVRGVSEMIEIDYDESRADAEILEEVESALRWHALVDHAMIDVAVDDGVATLSGVVGSAAERSKARNLAWVAGVTDVEADELEVRRWARDEDLRTDKYVDVSDAAAHTALKDALLYDPRTTSYEITAQIDDGVATLRGSVDSLLAKRAAAQVARNTVGIRHVNNRIKVNPLPTREDGEIAEDVTAALERNPYVGRHEVTVAVTEGVAHLYGTVDSFYEKAQADDAAGAVAGVLEVDNNLDVADVTDSYIYDPYVDDWYIYGYDWYDYEYPAAMETDAEILDDIEDQLFWSPFVDSDDVNVSVEDGVATLTGEVDSWSEFEAARENAFEGGATWVKNYVTVE